MSQSIRDYFLLPTVSFAREAAFGQSMGQYRAGVKLIERLIRGLTDEEIEAALQRTAADMDVHEGSSNADERCPHGVLRIATCITCARSAQTPPLKGV